MVLISVALPPCPRAQVSTTHGHDVAKRYAVTAWSESKEVPCSLHWCSHCPLRAARQHVLASMFSNDAAYAWAVDSPWPFAWEGQRAA